MRAFKLKLKWLVIGALFGYFVFHPSIHLISMFHFFGEHSEAEFSHGTCPGCAKKLYP
jgi:hypothetical protein